jgi:hypothetical protein
LTGFNDNLLRQNAGGTISASAPNGFGQPDIIADYKYGVLPIDKNTIGIRNDTIVFLDRTLCELIGLRPTNSGGSIHYTQKNHDMIFIEKLKSMIAQKGLICESLYIVGDSTLKSWVRQFDIAKQFGVKYVTTEPPLNMWDQIDSLAGAYGIKVAIHEHWKGFSHYWNPDTTLMALKGHPNFGVCADLGHWPKSGIDPLDAVKKLSGHIIVIHLKDIAAYNDPKLVDVPVGTGVVKFPEIFAELKKQNFNGYIYIERDAQDQPGNLPSVIQEIKYYNEQIGKLK